MDIRIKMMPSEAGTQLLQKNTSIDDLYVLYKKQDVNDKYLFAGFYNPQKEYDKNCIAVPFTSSYDGSVSKPAGTIFSNVLRSSEDFSKVYYGGTLHSWKELAEALNIQWCCLAEKDKFYDVYTNAAYVPTTKLEKEKFSCNDYDVEGNLVSANIVGGHVILKQTPSSMPKDASEVYIIPICKHHNSLNLPHKDTKGQNLTSGNGNGFFMKLRIDTAIIKLKGYLKPPVK